MKKAEFLTELTNRLMSINKTDLDNYLAYFGEIIDDRIEDGMSEEEAVASLESPDVIASQILETADFENLTQNEPAPNQTPMLTSEYIKFYADYDVSNLSQINLSARETTVDIIKSVDDKVHLCFWQNDKDYYFIEITPTGVLNIQNIRTYRWFDYLKFWRTGGLNFQLALPEKLMCSLNVRTSNANIKSYDISTSSNVTLTTSNSSVAFQNSYVGGTVELVTSNSKIIAESFQAESVFCKTSNSPICFSNINCTGKITGKTNNSKITAETVNCDTVDFQSSNSPINLWNCIVNRSLYAKTSNGHIKIDNVFFGEEMSLITSNSSISGNISDSQRSFGMIDSKTSNGRNNLMNTMNMGGKRLTVQTSNGNIDVRFTQL